MPSTDTKPELTAKASMVQPVSQPAVYANGLNSEILFGRRKLEGRERSYPQNIVCKLLILSE
jgi:hypothetical protein